MTTCKICVVDDSFPGFSLDDKGVCNYCKLHHEMENEMPNDHRGTEIINKKILSIKKRNKNSDYDVVVGISGGRDSTYLLYYLTKIQKLRCLAIHMNDGFGNPVAGKNMENATKILNVDFKVFTTDWKLSKDLKKSFLKACVPDIETPTDIAIASALYAACVQYHVKDIFIGQSFRTEGISPLEWNFLDGKYVKDVQKKYGTEKFPSWEPNKLCFDLDIKKMFYYVFIKRINTFNPFYYLDYNRKNIDKIISKELNWQDTGAHYYDDLYQTLMSSWYKKKFGIDRRKFNYSALIRSGQMTRDEALNKLEKDYVSNQDEMVALCTKRIGITNEDLDSLIKNNSKNTFKNFNTSYNFLKYFSFAIKYLSKLNILPTTTYYKYFKF
tara:strand:- start:593 stop:1741 length:1149 start_codon:yes stop_codon:yes gene_type:complete